MRRRPTAVYRVLDEEDLLSGDGFIDVGGLTDADWASVDPEAQAAGPTDADWASVDPEAQAGGPTDAEQHESAAPGVDAGRRARARILGVCAGALVLAVLVARLASILLAGGGTLRTGRAVHPQPALPPATVIAGVQPRRFGPSDAARPRSGRERAGVRAPAATPRSARHPRSAGARPASGLRPVAPIAAGQAVRSPGRVARPVARFSVQREFGFER